MGNPFQKIKTPPELFIVKSSVLDGLWHLRACFLNFILVTAEGFHGDVSTRVL